MRCPVCDRSLEGLSDSGVQVHVNACLDEALRPEDLLDGKGDGNVVGERRTSPTLASCSRPAEGDGGREEGRRHERVEAPASQLRRLLQTTGPRGKENKEVSLKGALSNILGPSRAVKKCTKRRSFPPSTTTPSAKVKDFGHKPPSSNLKRPRTKAPSQADAMYNHYGECLQEFVLSSEDAAKEDPSSLLVHCRHGGHSEF